MSYPILRASPNVLPQSALQPQQVKSFQKRAIRESINPTQSKGRRRYPSGKKMKFIQNPDTGQIKLANIPEKPTWKDILSALIAGSAMVTAGVLPAAIPGTAAEIPDDLEAKVAPLGKVTKVEFPYLDKTDIHLQIREAGPAHLAMGTNYKISVADYDFEKYLDISPPKQVGTGANPELGNDKIGWTSEEDHYTIYYLDNSSTERRVGIDIDMYNDDIAWWVHDKDNNVLRLYLKDKSGVREVYNESFDYGYYRSNVDMNDKYIVIPSTSYHRTIVIDKSSGESTEYDIESSQARLAGDWVGLASEGQFTLLNLKDGSKKEVYFGDYNFISTRYGKHGLIGLELNQALLDWHNIHVLLWPEERKVSLVELESNEFGLAGSGKNIFVADPFKGFVEGLNMTFLDRSWTLEDALVSVTQNEYVPAEHNSFWDYVNDEELLGVRSIDSKIKVGVREYDWDLRRATVTVEKDYGQWGNTITEEQVLERIVDAPKNEYALNLVEVVLQDDIKQVIKSALSGGSPVLEEFIDLVDKQPTYRITQLNLNYDLSFPLNIQLENNNLQTELQSFGSEYIAYGAFSDLEVAVKDSAGNYILPGKNHIQIGDSMGLVKATGPLTFELTGESNVTPNYHFRVQEVSEGQVIRSIEKSGALDVGEEAIVKFSSADESKNTGIDPSTGLVALLAGALARRRTKRKE